jgi:hypothetical protein
VIEKYHVIEEIDGTDLDMRVQACGSKHVIKASQTTDVGWDVGVVAKALVVNLEKVIGGAHVGHKSRVIPQLLVEIATKNNFLLVVSGGHKIFLESIGKLFWRIGLGIPSKTEELILLCEKRRGTNVSNGSLDNTVATKYCSLFSFRTAKSSGNPSAKIIAEVVVTGCVHFPNTARRTPPGFQGVGALAQVVAVTSLTLPKWSLTTASMLRRMSCCKKSMLGSERAMTLGFFKRD